jgi:phosphatidylserine decarboxylase
MVDIFIKKYNINTQKYIIHGLTFNDFFIRELKQPLTILKNNDTIYSPVTSRSLFYNFKNFYKLNLFIKGKNFTISKLINEKKILPKYSVIINRLAIQDYHHIHMPEDGILINITEINGTNISVDKDFINSEINVLNENKRVIFKFKRNDGSIFYLILIGSLLVASIKYDLELNKKYYTHEKIAFFQFGGSCVVYISDRNIFIDDDLSYFTNEEIESYVKVGEEIGNINNQSKKNFIKNYNIKKHIIGFFNNIIEIIINLIVKINNKLIKNIIMI